MEKKELTDRLEKENDPVKRLLLKEEIQKANKRINTDKGRLDLTIITDPTQLDE